ncbi:hypothetical protein OAI07_01185 [Akkermansiaceae bacterium]|nr:hypothetical protein [Akkermansiaceae bacterium]
MPSNKKGITVRFSEDEMEQLDALAVSYGVSSATVIRWALKALVEYVEMNNGKITLPLDFTEIMKQSASVNPLSSLEEQSSGGDRNTESKAS